MADEKEKPKIEPRWHKRNTLVALRTQRAEVRKAEAAIEYAETRHE